MFTNNLTEGDKNFTAPFHEFYPPSYMYICILSYRLFPLVDTFFSIYICQIYISVTDYGN